MAIVYERDGQFDDALTNVNMAIVLCDDEHEKNTILDRKKLIVAKKTAYDKKQGNMYGGLLGKGFYVNFFFSKMIG